MAYNKARTESDTLVAVTSAMYLALCIEHEAVIDVEEIITVCQDEYNSVCFADSSIRERRQKDKEDRLSLVLWRRPLTTLHYFLLETLVKLKEWTFE